jgi:HEAT repeat protein
MAEKKVAKSAESDMRLKISGLIEQVRCGGERGCAEDVRTQLVAIGAPALPALLEAIRTEKGAPRLALIKILWQIDDPASASALVELLSDDDFDARWEAVEGLSSLGYDSLEPLIAAIILNPGSPRLRNGAHHILHHVAEEGYYTLLKPLMMAIEGGIPNVEVPAAAQAVKAEIARTGLKSK